MLLVHNKFILNNKHEIPFRWSIKNPLLKIPVLNEGRFKKGNLVRIRYLNGGKLSTIQIQCEKWTPYCALFKWGF